METWNNSTAVMLLNKIPMSLMLHSMDPRWIHWYWMEY